MIELRCSQIVTYSIYKIDLLDWPNP